MPKPTVPVFINALSGRIVGLRYGRYLNPSVKLVNYKFGVS